MGIVNNILLRGVRKRVGGSVYYQAMGQTRQRELAASVTNPRTQSQMNQRVKWANLVSLYRANRSWMKYAFETRKRNQSEYNKFMSLNVADSRIYLTKPVANAGGCVVDTYLITQGSLPSIEFVPTTNGYFSSNIEVDENTNLNTISVKEFSDMVVRRNPAIRYGDQLSFIRMTQMTNASTGVPYVVVREYEVIIDTNNLQLLSDYLPTDLITTWGVSPNFLAVGTAAGRSGGFAMILSRTISGKTYVSTQRVILVAMDAYIEVFSSSTALQAAIDSYGVSEDAFLSSTYASQDNQAATMLALLYVSLGALEGTFAAGSRFVIPVLDGGDELRAYFNSTIEGTPSRVVLGTNAGNFVLEAPSKAGNIVQGLIPETVSTLENVVIMYVEVTLDSLTYRIDFLIRNEDTIPGIE